MTELIGDICRPSELTLPNKTTSNLPSAPIKGMIYYDLTINKIVFWNGSAYETITSTA